MTRRASCASAVWMTSTNCFISASGDSKWALDYGNIEGIGCLTRFVVYLDSCPVDDVLEIAILGFLNEGPLPGHELRRRVSQLTGYTRPVSDGSLYPAINRLAKAGLLERRPDSGADPVGMCSPRRRPVAPTIERLRSPAQHEITDFTRFFVVLTFLSQLPEVSDQHAVLRRGWISWRSRRASSTTATALCGPRTSPIRTGAA